MTVKSDLEQEFDNLLNDMKDDPLDGLMIDKLPTAEQIFFAEWANDWFPHVDIPTIGGYIESIGARAIGDIDLDGQPPKADLNISSKEDPSGLTQAQCKALWNSDDEQSIVYTNPKVWFDTVDGSSDYRSSLMSSYNLSDTQLDFIVSWINTSQNTWLLNLAQVNRLVLNPIPFFVFLGAGVVLIIISAPKVIREIKIRRKGKSKIVFDDKNLDIKKNDNLNNNKESSE